MNALALMPDKTKRYILIGVIVLVALVILFFVFRAIKKASDRKQNNNFDAPGTSGLATQYAHRLRTALNPSGMSWMINTDGTNEKEIMSVADAMKANKVTMSQVATAYYTAYKDDLAKRLQGDLDSGEFNEFLRRIGK